MTANLKIDPKNELLLELNDSMTLIICENAREGYIPLTDLNYRILLNQLYYLKAQKQKILCRRIFL